MLNIRHVSWAEIAFSSFVIIVLFLLENSGQVAFAEDENVIDEDGA